MITTASLPLAKELLELGLKIETEKYWVNNSARFDTPKEKWEYNWLIFCKCDSLFLEYVRSTTKAIYPAYSTDELLAMLPSTYHIWRGYPENDKGNWMCVKFSEPEFEYDEHWEQADTPVEALGRMCKYLLTNGYEFNGKEIVRKR